MGEFHPPIPDSYGEVLVPQNENDLERGSL